MDEQIEKFLIENKVFTMATSINEKPYCASCFYAFDKDNKALIFSSDRETKHIEDVLENPVVAGTINIAVNAVSEIRGIQFTGELKLDANETVLAEKYYKRFPFAKERLAPIWCVQLNWIKMTDNTLGFGTKVLWERSGRKVI